MHVTFYVIDLVVSVIVVLILETLYDPNAFLRSITTFKRTLVRVWDSKSLKYDPFLTLMQHFPVRRLVDLLNEQTSRAQVCTGENYQRLLRVVLCNESIPGLHFHWCCVDSIDIKVN